MARLANPKIQYFYSNGASFGEPLTNGYIYFYDSGTLNEKATYADSGLSKINPNPLPLDGAGRISSPFLDGNYKVILFDKDGVQQFELDPVQGSLSEGQWADWDITTTYVESDIVRGSDNFYYKSITNDNLGNNPISSSANWSQILFIVQWNENETYALNDNVIQNGTQYKSLQDGNLNNPPDVSPSFWGVPTGGIVAGNPASLLVNDVPYLEAGNNLDDVADLPTTLINIGLDQVDNTSDLDKPVSAATQAALDLKANSADVYDQTVSDARFVNVTGDTMTGPLAGVTPTLPEHYTTKEYVDELSGKTWVNKFTGSSITVANSWGAGEYLVRVDPFNDSNAYSYVVISSEIAGATFFGTSIDDYASFPLAPGDRFFAEATISLFTGRLYGQSVPTVTDTVIRQIWRYE